MMIELAFCRMSKPFPLSRGTLGGVVLDGFAAEPVLLLPMLLLSFSDDVTEGVTPVCRQ